MQHARVDLALGGGGGRGRCTDLLGRGSVVDEVGLAVHLGHGRALNEDNQHQHDGALVEVTLQEAY